jgi:hypothetical protein
MSPDGTSRARKRRRVGPSAAPTDRKPAGLKAGLQGAKSVGTWNVSQKARAMNKRRGILTASLILIGLTGEIGDTRTAAAASHYPLWACGARYGGWGWSRPAGPFTGLTPEALFRTPAAAYWYPAYSYDTYAYTYIYPYPYVIYVPECRYWWFPG